MTRLWPEAIATGDAIAYAEQHKNPDLERESYRILFPAYDTYVGGSLGRFAPPVALPIYAGAVFGGHAVGRIEVRLVPDEDVENLVAEDDAQPLPESQVSHDGTDEPAGEDDTGTCRLAWWPFRRQ